MSRIGSNIIIIPKGLQIQQLRTFNYLFLFINGYYKKFVVCLPSYYLYYKYKNIFLLKPLQKYKSEEKKMWGFYTCYLISLLQTVEIGFSLSLELRGVGFRVKIQNNKLLFFLGYSHIKSFLLPKLVYAKVINKKETELVLFGSNKQYICQIAAQIKLLKVPDLYKGKGIFFFNETVKLKQGKQILA